MPCLAECLMVQWIRSGEEEWLEGKGRETLPLLGRPLWQAGGGAAGACLEGGQQRSLEPAQCAYLRRLSTAANRPSLVLVIFNSETWSILLSSIIPVLCSICQQSSRYDGGQMGFEMIGKDGCRHAACGVVSYNEAEPSCELFPQPSGSITAEPLLQLSHRRKPEPMQKVCEIEEVCTLQSGLHGSDSSNKTYLLHRSGWSFVNSLSKILGGPRNLSNSWKRY